MKVSITVDDDFHVELGRYAKWKGEMNISCLLRLAVKHYMRQYPLYERKRKKNELYIEKTG